MATKHGTEIQWTHIPKYKGETWNPVTGCVKVSDGCKYCYAERVFPRVYGKDRKFSDVKYHPDRLDKPYHWDKPRAVFVNSMSDLYQDDVGLMQMLQIYKTMIQCPRHIFMILTKRPENLLSVIENDLGKPEELFPPHIWHGVSVEDQATADKRIPLLLQIPSKVRFVSYEPALGPVDLTAIKRTHAAGYMRPLDGRFRTIDWVIAGGESGPKARASYPSMFPKVRDDCKAGGIPFFFKQWGEWAPSLQGVMVRVGKKVAGDFLDGQQHHEFPNIRSSHV